MRKESINKLLAAVKEIVVDLTDQKESAKENYEITELVEPKVKTALEHLRSSLDYTAQDIHNLLPRKNKGHVYFPYTDKSVQFNSRVQGNLPNLKSDMPDVYNLIRSMQSFESNDNWLDQLCKFTNSSKHDDFVEQQRKDSGSVTMPGVAAHGVTGFSFSGNTMNGKPMPDVYLDDKGRSQIPASAYSSEVKFSIDTQFRFKDSQIDIIDLLTRSLNGISGYVEKLYPLLEK